MPIPDEAVPDHDVLPASTRDAIVYALQGPLGASSFLDVACATLGVQPLRDSWTPETKLDELRDRLRHATAAQVADVVDAALAQLEPHRWERATERLSDALAPAGWAVLPGQRDGTTIVPPRLSRGGTPDAPSTPARPFAERYAAATPPAEAAPPVLQRRVLDVLADAIPLRPMLVEVARLAGRSAATDVSSPQMREEIEEICASVDWRTFYQIVEELLRAEVAPRGATDVRTKLNTAFAQFTLPWRVTDSWSIDAEGNVDAWGFGLPAPADPPANPVSPATSLADPLAAASTPAHRNDEAPTTEPERASDREVNIRIGAGGMCVAIAGVCGVAAQSARGALSIVLWVLSASAVVVAVAIFALLIADEKRRTQGARRWIVCGTGAAIVVAVGMGIFVAVRAAPSADPGASPVATAAPAGPVERQPGMSDHPVVTVEHHAAPGTLTLQQRDTIAEFARAHPHHSAFIWAAGSDRALMYANSLADALEAGGWTIDGRGQAKPGRPVTYRLGPVLRPERRVAVAPATGLGADVAAVLRKIGLQPQPWLPSLPEASSDVRIWYAP